MIEWFTVAAQIFNFLILVWLLKRFLYGPIIKAMDKREETIRNRLQDAEAQRADAHKRAEEFAQRKAELEKQSEEMLTEARGTAEAEHKRLIDEARADADASKERWQKELRREQDAFLRDVRRTVGSEAVHVAGRALAEIADARLESQTAKVFVDRLNGLEEKEREAIQSAMGGDGEVVVRSAFELEGATLDQIGAALKAVLGRDVKVHAEQSDELLCGIELAAGGHKVAWSLAKYVNDAKREIEQVFQGVGAEQESGDGAGENNG